MMFYQIGSGKSNMATTILEVPISQLVDNGAKSQRLIFISVSGVQLSNGIGCDTDRLNRK